ncbi:MAG: hypothetical protein WBQ59_17300 [Candidatus Acidiferrum sp.]
MKRRVDRRHFGGDFDFFADGSGLHRNNHARGFRDANVDLVGLGFGESGFIDDHEIGSGWKQRDKKRPFRAGRQMAHELVGGAADDLHVRVRDASAAYVRHISADGAGGAALAVCSR